MPLPPSMPFDFDLFFIDLPAGYRGLGGRVIALGVEMPSEAPPPSASHERMKSNLPAIAFGHD